MKYFMLAIIMSIFIIQCTDNSYISDISVINVKDSEEISNLSELFSEIEYIPLLSDISYGSIFNNWLSVSIKNDKIYLFEDADVYENVYSFDMMGNYNGHISFPGEGPGKIVNGSSFYVTEGNQIEVLDNYAHKIVRYNMNNGKFVSETSLENDFVKFLRTGERILFYRKNQKSITDSVSYNLVLTDENFNRLSSHVEIPDYLINYRVKDYNFSNQINETVLFKNFLSNEIYEINTGKISKKYFVDLGDKWVSQDILNQLSIDNSRNTRRVKLYEKKDHIYHIVNLLHTESIILMTYFYNEKFHWILYDKQTGEVKNFKNRINDLDYSLLGQKLYWPRSIYNNSVVFIVSTDDLKYDLSAILKRYKISELRKIRSQSAFAGYEKFVNSLDPNVDGVMILAKLRE